MASWTTADLYDQYANELQVLAPIFQNYGGLRQFCGTAMSLKVYQDNSLVRAALEQPHDGHVLVVDGGMSIDCALVGDNLAKLAIDNGWAGIIVAGAIRDSAIIKTLQIGVQAINTNPRKSVKKGIGERDVSIEIGGCHIQTNDYIYADDDGIMVATKQLHVC